MDARPITPDLSVSPQIMPEDVADIAAAGFKTVICNRPDEENPPALSASALREAVEAAGLVFQELPFNQMTLTMEIVAQQARLIAEAEKPVLAYCASGNRCCSIWALIAAKEGQSDVASIVETGAKAGYDLRGLTPTLTALSEQG